MQTKCTRQGKAFRVTALADQILHFVPMADGNGGLLNDWAVIQIFGDVVSCCADELDPCLLYTSPSPRD